SEDGRLQRLKASEAGNIRTSEHVPEAEHVPELGYTNSLLVGFAMGVRF
ncbi:hypothetical protein A2U01_0104203, partial [Trifolium medium]|nr:hypothetical protein [Trifolium medium]